MKKIVLLIFAIIPLHAGRFIGGFNDKINDYKVQILKIRTQLGYDLPPEEFPQLSVLMRIKLLEKFEAVWHDYKLNQNAFRKFFSVNSASQSNYNNFVVDIMRDKNRYQQLMALEIVASRRRIELATS